MRTVILLVLSNTFMTIAWYGHLRFRQVPLALAIAVSWLIALPEYARQVPANRLGFGAFTATQLKVIQEVISVSVFMVFVYFYLGEAPTWRTGLAFLLILGAVALVVMDQRETQQTPTAAQEQL
jgi:uncharacterized protein (DUF486 family)